MKKGVTLGAVDADLRRELSEAGAPDASVPELIDLVVEIQELPLVTPRRSWLHESKWRMLRRFDERNAKRLARRDSAPAE